MPLIFTNYALIFAAFAVGYLTIIFEHLLKVNKTAIALLIGTLCWGLLIGDHLQALPEILGQLNHHLSDVSQIVFFLLGAMVIVETMDSSGGLGVLKRCLRFKTHIQVLWGLSLMTFFLSALLDNLTTTLVMLSLLKGLIAEKNERWKIGAAIVIAANAGGAFSPIGDVTTTMLWIGGQVSAPTLVAGLTLPSLVSLLVTLGLMHFQIKKEPLPAVQKSEESASISGLPLLILGLSSLVLVPILKTLFHIPPFLGMLIGIGVMWLVYDVIERKKDVEKQMPFAAILRKVDYESLLFFLGILLGVASLESAGILEGLAGQLKAWVSSLEGIAYVTGILSAIIDNVPLVAASMGMYSMVQYPADSAFWHLIAYCAGTGGSLLIIGSASGIAFMGIERVDFFWYVKHVTLVALVGYTVGFGLCLLMV